MLEFIGLTMIVPCVIYALLFHSLTPHTEGQWLVGGGLATVGGWIWAIRNA